MYYLIIFINKNNYNMSDTRNKVLLYRTNKKGSVDNNIEHGELALNFNAETPFLMLKDTENNIQKIGVLSNSTGQSEYHTMTQKAITDVIENIELNLSSSYESVEYPSVTDTEGMELFKPAESGQTLDEAIKTVDQNVATLVQEVLNNEQVVSMALNKHNESAGFDENALYVKDVTATYINNATTLSEADSLLDGAIKNVSDDLINSVNEINTEIENIISSVTESANEVYIGESTPTMNSIELFIDESIDPISVEVYSKEEVDTKVNALNNIDSTLTSSLNSKITYGDNKDESLSTDLYVDTSANDSIEVYTRAQVDAIIAKLKADNNLI